jgi:hypothetical protein
MYKYLCFIAMSIFSMDVIQAADIETLLMPGKVIEGHAEYESECSRCHAHFSKRKQSDLCRDCHEDIDADIRNNRGYHSHVPDIKDKPCKSCHTDHTGRQADIVMLNLATFDHGNTDFLLEDGHKGIPCSNCHLQDIKFSETSSTCFDCHEKQDPHKGKLGEKCGNCHTAKTWEKFDFDHDKTEFRLQGKHQDVACNICHINNKYKETPKDCHSCHYLNDVHEGRQGRKCQDCHSTSKWDQSKFDHDRETEFKLTGKHKDISCKACHTKALPGKKPEKECYSCHKQDDNHRGRYGKKCHSCHKQNNWGGSQFDHTENTRFPLRGKHKKLICASCHQGVLSEENLSVECNSCHRADDVHKSKQGEQCQHCHQDTGWSEGVLFDHGLTHFPLLGMHALATCEECHISAAFQDTETKCNACHGEDDKHKTALGSDCKQCHNPNSWNVWIFDHDRQTDFELEGAHSELHCEQCHYKPVKSEVRQSSQCHACHEFDDAHRGQFGRYCERCHISENFSTVTIH